MRAIASVLPRHRHPAQGGEGQQRERPADAVRHAGVAVPAGEVG